MICRKCGADKPEGEFRPLVKRGHTYQRYACRECERAVSLAHARAHAEERRAYSRVYGQEHATERQAYRRRRRAENGPYLMSEAQKERHRETERIRKQAMSAEQRHARYAKLEDYFRARSARLRGATEIAIVDTDAIVARDGGRCYLCGKDVQPGFNLTLDHVVPISLGGAHTEANLRLACRSCNARKRNKLPDELAG